MSGGVDSSVAAYLLQRQGYEVIGATMQLVGSDLAPAPIESGCCSLNDVEDAKMVCAKLGIPHYTLNFKEEFRREVVEDFVHEYAAGRTPNPCIRCNRYLKFEKLMARALELGCTYLATGHYAQVVRCDAGTCSASHDDGGLLLKKGVDAGKDQSYVLYTLNQRQLAHLLLPLGGLTKGEVRRIAEEAGLRTAHKAESQDICFIPDGGYAAFLESYAGLRAQPGPIEDEQGRVLGQHEGIYHYTYGQRKGLGLGGGVTHGDPYYVSSLDVPTNTVRVAHKEQLAVHTVRADDFHWIAATTPGSKPITAKCRYRQSEQAVEGVEVAEDGSVRVRFREAQCGVAPGQALVLYCGDTVLGGGTIAGAAS
jgi:tRNA-specific 2-thiouridylase